MQQGGRPLRIHKATPTRIVLIERHPSSVALLWFLLAGAPVGASIAYKHRSWLAGLFAAVCLGAMAVLWRWGARRVVRATRDGTIRLRDHEGVHWEYAMDEIEEVEVCGDPEARGGHDYQVILEVRRRGWVSLCPGSAMSRKDAALCANAVRQLLGWEPIKESAAEVRTAPYESGPPPPPVRLVV